MPARRSVDLVDTDVITELRKKDKANPRVAAFFKGAAAGNMTLTSPR